MNVNDIQGTRTKTIPERNTEYTSFYVEEKPKIYYKDKEPEEIEGSKPNPLPNRKNGPQSLHLDVGDIDGTKPGSRGLRAFRTHKRREVREINKCNDIPGTKVGSLKKAPSTNRQVNPLNPNYDLLGAKELNNYNMYDENVPQNAKPVSAPVKTRKENVERSQAGKQLNLDKEAYKRDLVNFYGTEPGFMQEIDFKKITKN